MLRVQENSRQVPRSKEIVSNKDYQDLIYGYLQSISEWDGVVGHPRYVQKKNIVYTTMGQILNVSRQTASKNFKKMVDSGESHNLGLIRDVGDKYELITLPKNLATLVPRRTLSILISSLNKNAISVYTYLLNEYIKREEKPFQINIDMIKEFIGIGTKSRSNNETITEILYVLQKLGLLKYFYNTNTYGEGKRSYSILWMTNSLDEDFKFEEERSQAVYESLKLIGC